jgi:hypothetical protein
MPKMKGGLTTDGIKFKKLFDDANVTTLAVGFLGNEKHNLVGNDGVAREVGDIAREQEYGNTGKRVPPRPFMRNAIDNIKDNAAHLVGTRIPGILSGGETLADVFSVLGEYSSAEVVAAIKNVHAPKLSHRTINERLKRGNSSSKPLEDTGQMLGAVNYEVKT